MPASNNTLLVQRNVPEIIFSMPPIRTFLVPFCLLLALSIVNYRANISQKPDSFVTYTGSARKNSVWENLFSFRFNLDENTFKLPKKVPSTCESTDDFILSITGPKESPETLQDYIKFHRDARECLASARCKKKPKVLIWRCNVPNHPCAGLGDRLRGIAGAFLLAYSSNRVFFIDWPVSNYDHFDLTVALIPASIDWRMPYSLITAKAEFPAVFWGNQYGLSDDFMLPGGNKFNPKIGNFEKETENSGIFYLSTMSSELFISKYQSNLNSTKNIPDVRALSTTVLVRAILKSLFRPSQVVSDLADQVYPKSKTSYISIHSRTGDDLGESTAKGFVNMTSHEKVSISLLNCASKIDPIGATKIIYLAADSISFKQIFVKKAQNYGYGVITPHWRALHLRRNNAVMGKVSDEKHCREYLNIFVDLILMSRGKALVSTGSGFARMAFYFGNSIGHFIGYDQETDNYCKLQKYLVLQ